MANQEHLEILKQGVEVWNQWRNTYPDIEPYLRFANLSGMNLINANLNGADLVRANLSFADLTETHLIGAKLSLAYLISTNFSRADLTNAYLIGSFPTAAQFTQADLTGANLRGSDLTLTNLTESQLSRADLTDADLINANLTKADLVNTNLIGADLTYANFTQSSMAFTILGGINLHLALGLDTVIHLGPSNISIDTIIRSDGKIPESFLRNAGVPVSIIETIPSLVGSLKPIDFYSCFISCSKKDRLFADRLYANLRSKGVRCWFAPEDLKIGDHYHQRIDESIRLYDKLILILSEHAIQSSWVEREVVSAREKEDHLGHEVLFPIRIDGAVMDTTKAWAADVRRRWHIGDFTQWKNDDAYQQAFEHLLRDLKAEQRSKN